MKIKMNGKFYSGICSTEANNTNHKRFEDDILEIADEPCYQSADQNKTSLSTTISMMVTAFSTTIHVISMTINAIQPGQMKIL